VVKSWTSCVAAAASVLAVCGSSVGCDFLGDHFARASGRVLDCSSLSPIVGADISINVDRGDSPGPYSSGGVNTTSASGQFDVHTALRIDTLITLTFKKAGYAPLSYQFEGEPKGLELCMMPH
jgi:hypothetical protein